ncbi:MAG: hypothetical protein Q9200_007419, partial [Gallowayella weberi]
MLSYLVSISLVVATPVLATNTAGDPTDLSNWPACADVAADKKIQQECVPQGFGPPANCHNISALSDRFCAPVGGVGPQVSSALNAFYATNSVSITATPTVPPGVTASSAVSSVLATATLTPDLGNPADITAYPLCG